MASTSGLPISPSPPSAPSEIEKANAWFVVQFNHDRLLLLQKALRVLVSEAAPSTDLSVPTGAGDVYVEFYILAESFFIVAKTTVANDRVVDTCLEIKKIDWFCVSEDHVVRLNLGLLLEKIDNAVLQDLALFMKEEEGGRIICSLKAEDQGRPMETSVITVTPSDRRDWPAVKTSFTLGFQMLRESFGDVMSWETSPVKITVTNKRVKFTVGGDDRQLSLYTDCKTESVLFKMLYRTGNAEKNETKFSFHPRDAILNAKDLAAHVNFHRISDSRSCLEIPVDGLGSIYFLIDP